MTELCPVPATGNAFLSGILQYIDCQAQTIGETGYQALANPGSTISLALTALLTIFIAIFGIRMLMGHVPNTSELVSAFLKIGVVLLLATSWAAYRVVAYETVLHGPAELVQDIGSPSGLPGAEGGLIAHLQAVDDGVVALIDAGTGRLDPVLPNSGGSPTAILSKHTPISDDFALGLARVAYLGGTIGSLALVRLVAGLLLALAPLIAGLLLFEGTRSFFMGWARTLVAAALGALAITVMLGVELGILEPWLTGVLALRAAHYATPAAPIELLVITLAFALGLFGMIAVSTRLAFVAQAPAWLRERSHGFAEELHRWRGAQPLTERMMQDAPLVSRAHVVADAVASVQRREAMLAGDGARRRTAAAVGEGAARAVREGQPASFVPIGQRHRRTVQRISASATKRSSMI